MKKSILLLTCVFSLSLHAAAPLTEQQAIWQLSEAVQKGDVDKARELLEENEIDINATVRGGWTFLMDAAHHGHADTIELLLGVEGINVNASKDERTALYWAADQGATDAVEKLTHVEGIDLEASDEISRTPLMRAAFNGIKEVVQILLDAGADKFKQDMHGQNAEEMARSGVEEVQRMGYDQKVVNKFEETADLIRDYIPSNTKSAGKR